MRHLLTLPLLIALTGCAYIFDYPAPNDAVIPSRDLSTYDNLDDFCRVVMGDGNHALTIGGVPGAVNSVVCVGPAGLTNISTDDRNGHPGLFFELKIVDENVVRQLPVMDAEDAQSIASIFGLCPEGGYLVASRPSELVGLRSAVPIDPFCYSNGALIAYEAGNQELWRIDHQTMLESPP